eukprot:3158221-Rhodomonas_salina.1
MSVIGLKRLDCKFCFGSGREEKRKGRGEDDAIDDDAEEEEEVHVLRRVLARFVFASRLSRDLCFHILEHTPGAHALALMSL